MAKYNGWHNYATWRINLELFDNDEYWNEVLEDMEGDDPDDIQYVMTEMVEEYVDECLNNQCCDSSLVRSYADAFIADVSYYEIAKHLIEAYEMEKKYQNA